ncbi:MAG: 50S ribosomal protein L11 methyltransferase [Desulfomonile tiedjei]|nr:50S ribosomal protein L11 methyltransferase [Desulfomonile tiedjei]
MIPPGTNLHIYEIRGDIGTPLPPPPASFIGIWNEEELWYLFFTRPENDYVAALSSQFGSELGSHHEMKYEDWQTGLPPEGISVGGVRFVAPNGRAGPERTIILDPTVVFGDGNHPTTLCCLRFLEQILRSRVVGSMLDLGTGTGILALAAAAMGVKHVLAADRNYLAVDTTRRNVEVNSLSSVIRVELGEARLFVDKPFDLVAANLPFQVLRDVLARDGASRHKWWIVSGIHQEQAEVLKELFREQGHEIQAERSHRPWVTFITENIRRRPS